MANYTVCLLKSLLEREEISLPVVLEAYFLHNFGSCPQIAISSLYCNPLGCIADIVMNRASGETRNYSKK